MLLIKMYMLSVIRRLCCVWPLSLPLILIACGRQPETFDVVNIASGKDAGIISWNSLDSVKLGLADGKEIGFIDKVLPFDSGYIVCTSGKMLLYWNDGSLVRQIGRSGRASDEYLGYSDSWLSDGHLFLYDLNGRKVISYSLDGEVLDVVQVENTGESLPFQFVVPFGDGYVGKCIWNGTEGESPALAYYDSDFRYSVTLGELTVRSGLRLGYPIVPASCGTLLYWNPLGRDIYRISPDLRVEKAYEITFGAGRNFPALDTVDEYDLLDMARDADWRSAHSGPVTYVWEYGERLLLLYYRGAQLMFSSYDRENREVETFGFGALDGKALLSSVFYDGKIHFFIENEDSVVVKILDLCKL